MKRDATLRVIFINVGAFAILWCIHAVVIYCIGGVVTCLHDARISESQAKRITVCLSTETTIITLCCQAALLWAERRLSCSLYLKLFGATTLVAYAGLVLATTFWTDPVSILFAFLDYPARCLFSEFNWLGFLIRACPVLMIVSVAVRGVSDYLSHPPDHPAQWSSIENGTGH
jgi:hypothetical protein